MILFNLKCSSGHDFDMWFRNGAAYETRVAGAVTCPACGSVDVTKAPMAPRIARGGREPESSSPPPPPPPSSPPLAEMAGQLRALCRKVAETCDYVGDHFAEEARRIHYGESKPRNIYGDASPSEVAELRDEGVEFQQMPWLPPTNS